MINEIQIKLKKHEKNADVRTTMAIRERGR